MDTRESSAPLAHPSTDDHDDTVETHYSGLERPVLSETDTLKGKSSSPCEANSKGLCTQPPRRRILRTSPLRSSEKFALRVGLLLYHRFCWLGRGYRVCVSMHHLPGTLFRPKDRRNPHGNRGNIFPSLNLCLASLYLHCVGKLRGCVLRYVLEAGGLAISVVRCGTLQGRSDLNPSTCGWAEEVSKGCIVSTGVDSFITFCTPFHDLIER